MSERWVDNDKWVERDWYNTAPRYAITECEPLHHRHHRVIRLVVKVVLLGGLLAVIIVGAFYFARL